MHCRMATKDQKVLVLLVLKLMDQKKNHRITDYADPEGSSNFSSWLCTGQAQKSIYTSACEPMRGFRSSERKIRQCFF